MNSYSANNSDTTLRQAVIDFMHFIDQKFNNQLTHSQLADFIAKINILEKDKKLDKAISLLLKTNLSKKIKVDGFALAKEYHVSAVFLIVRKMLPQSEIPTSLEFNDVKKDYTRIADSCGLLFGIGDCIDLSR